MHSPRKPHLEAVRHILRYLKTCPGRGILYKNHGHVNICGFSDADWAGCSTDRRSTSGYYTFVGGNLVTWRSKKQHVVSRSSAEAEYRAIAHGTCELLWLKSIMKELGLFSDSTIPLYCDDQAAIHIASDSVLHERTKHIKVDIHFIR